MKIIKGLLAKVIIFLYISNVIRNQLKFTTMTKLKKLLRVSSQLVISSFTMMFIMEKLFNDLPIPNFFGVYTFGAMSIFVLLLSYETPIKSKKKRPLGNYFKNEIE